MRSTAVLTLFVAASLQFHNAEIGTAMRGSAMRRTKVEGLRRNIAVAIHNAQPKKADRLRG